MRLKVRWKSTKAGTVVFDRADYGHFVTALQHCYGCVTARSRVVTSVTAIFTRARIYAFFSLLLFINSFIDFYINKK